MSSPAAVGRGERTEPPPRLLGTQRFRRLDAKPAPSRTCSREQADDEHQRHRQGRMQTHGVALRQDNCPHRIAP